MNELISKMEHQLEMLNHRLSMIDLSKKPDDYYFCLGKISALQFLLGELKDLSKKIH